MSSSSGIEKKVTLKSSDGEIFEVEEWVAVVSLTIKHMVELDCADTVIPLPNVTGAILSKVIEYCEKHGDARGEKKDDKSYEEELKNWDRDFVKADDNTIFDLILAANYLNIPGLLDFTTESVIDRVMELLELELSKIVDINNSFTLEEERRVLDRAMQLLNQALSKMSS